METVDATYDECAELVAGILGIEELFLSDIAGLGVVEAELHALEILALGYERDLATTVVDVVHDAVWIVPFVREEGLNRITLIIVLDDSELVVGTSGNLCSEMM